ncbi:MAG: hypothetical protein ABIG64_07335 [Candidatus Omnitrophota bacterium]
MMNNNFLFKNSFFYLLTILLLGQTQLPQKSFALSLEEYCLSPQLTVNNSSLREKFSDVLPQGLEIDASLLEHLAAQGVNISKIKKRPGISKQYVIDTESLQVTRSDDQKSLWVMHKLREPDMTTIIYPLEKLLASPISLTAPLSIQVSSVTLTGDNNAGVFLTFIQGKDSPVIIKKFKKTTSLFNIRNEIFIAQLLSAIGVFPQFYGVTILSSGEYAYAMQPSGGKYKLRSHLVANSRNILFKNEAVLQQYDIIRHRLIAWEIYTNDIDFQFLESSLGSLILIDAGSIARLGVGERLLKQALSVHSLYSSSSNNIALQKLELNTLEVESSI